MRGLHDGRDARQVRDLGEDRPQQVLCGREHARQRRALEGLGRALALGQRLKARDLDPERVQTLASDLGVSLARPVEGGSPQRPVLTLVLDPSSDHEHVDAGREPHRRALGVERGPLLDREHGAAAGAAPGRLEHGRLDDGGQERRVMAQRGASGERVMLSNRGARAAIVTRPGRAITTGQLGSARPQGSKHQCAP